MLIVRELEEKILAEGKAVNSDILKVDGFINHQVDPVLMKKIGEEFAKHFSGRGITKVVTIESSGIAPALMTALALDVPMIIFKKQPSKVLNDDLYKTVVTSFTKGTNYELTLSKKYISENDHVTSLPTARRLPARSDCCAWHMPRSQDWVSSLRSPTSLDAPS